MNHQGANPHNPTCILLILRNCPKNFQESPTLETGLSDFHKIVLTVFKSETPSLTSGGFISKM